MPKFLGNVGPMLMTYSLDTMESLEASRWHNEAILCRRCYTPAFPSSTAGHLYVHNNTAGSGDLYRATFQRAQFAIHLPSVPFCPSSTIDLP